MLSHRFRDFWRDFNTENRWRFPELPPSDILQALDRDISDERYEGQQGLSPAIRGINVEDGLTDADPDRLSLTH
jgi:hypothetical protein